MADFGKGNGSGPAVDVYIAATEQTTGEADVVGYLQGVDLGAYETGFIFVNSLGLGGASTPKGDGRSIAKQLAVGIEKSTTEGDPAQPCLKINQPGMWRFRWLVPAGARTISVKVKQAVNAAPYPSMVVKANPACGVNADVTGTSAGGAGWVTIGPINVSPSSNGSLWVELWNNYNLASNCPAFFDHVVVT